MHVIRLRSTAPAHICQLDSGAEQAFLVKAAVQTPLLKVEKDVLKGLSLRPTKVLLTYP